MSGTVQTIEHPADTGIEIWADTLPELFTLAARGLVSTGVEHPKKITAVIKKEISATGADLKELMVNFLSEFLYLIDTENFVMAKCQIDELSTTNNFSIRATAWGEAFDLTKHGSVTDIKAITYHQMIIEEVNQQWHARIIFDI